MSYILEESLSFEYNMFLLEDIIEQYKLETYINESILLVSESTSIGQFRIVHETLKEKLTNTFNSLIENISKLWGRFLETMSGLVKSDMGYLEKYKKLILTTELKQDTYVMFPYWAGYKSLIESKVPAFNFNSLKDHLNNEGDFIKDYFSGFIKQDVSYVDVAKEKFRGASKEQKIPSSKIDMNVLYNYCKDFDNIIKKIETDMKEVERAGNEAINIISKVKTTNESFAYSFVRESVVHEIETVKKVSDEKEKDEPKDSTQMKNVDGDKGEADKIKDDVTDVTKDIDRVKLYIKVCYSFLGAKMSIAQETYKAYMFIIRDHVKANVGSKSKETGKDEPEPKKTGEKEPEKKPAVLKKNLISTVGKAAKDKVNAVVQNLSNSKKPDEK